jgi:hypothetical protein
MFELKAVGVIRCGIVSAVLVGAGGLLEALFFVPFILAMPTEGVRGILPVLKPVFAIGALVAFPIFGALLGFIEGLIAAFIYNVSVRWTGGFRITLTPVSEAIPEASRL